MKNIDEIRINAITEIKEKVKKNSGYLHPCSKERQKDMIRLEFTNGYEYNRWLIQTRVMQNPINIDRRVREKAFKDAGYKTEAEYRNVCAQKRGFKNDAERHREWEHETGRSLPMKENENCHAHFGEFTENLMIQTFEDPIRMPPNNPGFDWKCKNEEKIDNKGARIKDGNTRWIFHIRYNNIADWFILSAWDNRCSLTPLYVWAFHRDDMVKYKVGGGYILNKFWKRESFSIPNNPKGLKEFEKYEINRRLEKLKELCNRKKENEKSVII